MRHVSQIRQLLGDELNCVKRTMNGKRLKNSILQWAIQGKLVQPVCRQAGKTPMTNLLADYFKKRKTLDHEFDKTLAEIQRILGINVNVNEL